MIVAIIWAVTVLVLGGMIYRYCVSDKDGTLALRRVQADILATQLQREAKLQIERQV